MQDNSLTVDSVREETKKLLGRDDINYDYITDETVAADAALGDESALDTDDTITTYYGNNARYGLVTINGVNKQVYFFNNGDQQASQGNMCGTSWTLYLLTDYWHHNYLGKCGNGRESWSFTRR